MAISTDDLLKFINERWSTPLCRRCGHPEWAAGEADTLKAVLPLGDDGVASYLQTSKSLPAFWLTCIHCGNVELINAKIIRRWKAKAG